MSIRLKDLPPSAAANLAPQRAKRERQIAPTERSGVPSVPRPPLETLGINAGIAYNFLSNPRYFAATKTDRPVVYDRLVDVLRALTALSAALEGVRK